MRAIVETESPSYLLHRSQELLRDADREINRFDHCEALRKAISLLALHLVKDDLREGHTPPGTRKVGGAGKANKAKKEKPVDEFPDGN